MQATGRGTVSRSKSRVTLLARADVHVEGRVGSAGLLIEKFQPVCLPHAPHVLRHGFVHFFEELDPHGSSGWWSRQCPHEFFLRFAGSCTLRL